MVAAGHQLGEFAVKREALIASASPGTQAARALSDLTDEAVSALAGAASVGVGGGSPFALFALGGYGARRLLPHSDIDLLIVTGAPTHEAERLVRAVTYPLWDLGLAVGHQVRTVKGQARAVTEDVEILTSFLTARFVTGDARLAEATVSATFRALSRPKARALALAWLSERERPGSPYLLEPDLKNGAGGQRDIDELVWRAALAAGSPRACRDPSLAEAQDAITAARWRLHRAASRAASVLTAEDADDLGADTDTLQRALETVHHALIDVREGCTAIPPTLDLDALGRMARGMHAVHMLERLAHAGALDAAVPDFSALMTLRRPALSHRFTVGAHSLRALVLAAQGAEGLEQPQAAALLVAALAHDLGKHEGGPGHAERGAGRAPAIAIALGADEAVAADAAMLVREHLLLAETATTRDLADEDMVLAAAAGLGKRELVAPLFELTAADMRATGPDVWTPWRAALIADLAAKLEAALAEETDGAGIVAAAEVTRSEALRQAASVGAPRSVLGFIENAPLRYLARRDVTAVLRDARLVQSLSGPGLIGEVALGVRPGPLDGTWLVDVATRDRPGLFAAISGALALSGLDALAAEAFTERSGIAIDTFTVTSATLASVEPATWSSLERALRTALRDSAALDVRLAEKRRHYPPKVTGTAARTRVTFGHQGPFTTGLRIRTGDRVGLLHDLTRAIERAGYDIRRAVITTTGGVADDTFEIVDAQGDAPGETCLAETLFPGLLAAAREQ